MKFLVILTLIQIFRGSGALAAPIDYQNDLVFYLGLEVPYVFKRSHWFQNTAEVEDLVHHQTAIKPLDKLTTLPGVGKRVKFRNQRGEVETGSLIFIHPYHVTLELEDDAWEDVSSKDILAVDSLEIGQPISYLKKNGKIGFSTVTGFILRRNWNGIRSIDLSGKVSVNDIVHILDHKPANVYIGDSLILPQFEMGKVVGWFANRFDLAVLITSKNKVVRVRHRNF